MPTSKMLLVVLFSACAIAQAIAQPCPSHGAHMARTELLFGAAMVSDAQWHKFLAREVTPRFPDGLTAFEGYGQWKRPDGAISAERSRILILWHRPDADSDRKIDTIRAAYKKQFRQLSILRVDGEDCVSF